MSWEMGVNEIWSVRMANTTIEPTEMTAPRFSLGLNERMPLKLRISSKLSCSRSTPATMAPPKKKNGT